MRRDVLACLSVLVGVAVAAPSEVVAHPADGGPVVATTTVDACGSLVVKPDGTPWRCTFADDFDGTTLDRTKWVPQTALATGTDATYACYRDDPANVSVAHGALDLTLLRHDAPAPCALGGKAPTPYQSGSVSTYHLFSQQYGRFEARVKNTATTFPGLQETFWLWPDDRASSATWPWTGEIDVSETYSAFPDLSIPFLHYWAEMLGPRPGLNTAWSCTAHRGEWNTYTFEWDPNRLEMFVDGTSCLVNTAGARAFQSPHIVALTQGIGAIGNAYDGRAPLPATMSVDYVRVWQ